MTEQELARFMKFVEPDGECLRWQGALDPCGYGRFRLRGRSPLVHRVAYEHFVGPIPEGLEIDHTCRVRDCVFHGHLEAVTHRENLRRGNNPMSMRTHCPQNHPYDFENTYVIPNGGGRGCRKCRDESARRYRERRRRARSS